MIGTKFVILTKKRTKRKEKKQNCFSLITILTKVLILMNADKEPTN